MSFTAAVKSCLRQYVTFTGRARRSEYWWFYLFSVLVLTGPYLVGLVLVVAAASTGDEVDNLSPTGNVLLAVGIGFLVLYFLVSLAILLPTLAVCVRRLHDTSRTGWWYLISLVPFGGIVLLVFFLLDSTPGPNEHGPNPKGVDALPMPPWLARPAPGAYPAQPAPYPAQPAPQPGIGGPRVAPPPPGSAHPPTAP